MTKIDPRLRERRLEVAEQNAKRDVGRLLRLIGVLVAAGAIVWLFLSPRMSIATVDLSGVSASNANSILADQRVVAGTPLIFIRSGSVEDALLTDPWIESADVQVNWPDQVAVTIVERTPVAWTKTADGWTRRAVDGVALPSAPTPDGVSARIVMPGLAPNEATVSTQMLGALDFVDSLPDDLREGTKVTMRDGELWSTVSGFQVQLGRPVEMREKARSLSALLTQDLPESSVLVLVAPTNPAVLPPQTTQTEEQPPDQGDGEGP